MEKYTKTINLSDAMDIPDAFQQDLQQVIDRKLDDLITDEGIDTDDIHDFETKVEITISVFTQKVK